MTERFPSANRLTHFPADGPYITGCSLGGARVALTRDDYKRVRRMVRALERIAEGHMKLTELNRIVREMRELAP